MSRLRLPQVAPPPPPDHPVDLQSFIHGSDVPANLEDAFTNVRQALEVTNNFNEVKDIRDQSETLRAHAKRVKWSLEIQNKCAEIKLRAERKAGTILAAFTVKGGERHNSHDGSCERHSCLDDLNISWNQSSRWQRISRIPEETFESFLRSALASNSELTQAAALRLDARLSKPDNLSDNHQMAKHHADKVIGTLVTLKHHLEAVERHRWRFVSKEEVRAKLLDLLDICDR